MIKPQLFYYPLAGIQSIESLAKHLDIDLDKLTYLLENINSQYIGPIFKKKSNGGSRPIYQCRPQLKYFLKRLNSKVFKLVHYPNFLYGALPNKSIYTNASQHLNAKVMCNFDIKSYFTTITFDHVFDIFKNFFHFSTEVSNILATLTTINNQVPQGSPCSTYIANLVFYRSEVNVANKLKDKNYVYTRFIDDITVSSQYKKTKKDIEEVHTIVIGMIRAYKFSLQTEKRSIAPSHKSQTLTVNQINIVKSNLSISKEKRKKIRAAVHELKCNLNDNNIEFVVKNFESVYGRVQYLKNIHIKEAQGLLKQLKQIRSKILKPLQIYKYRKLKEAIRKKQGYKL